MSLPSTSARVSARAAAVRRRPSWTLVAGVCFVTFAISVFLALFTQRIPFTSDQAIVGLMARHILAGKGHPVFYYGAAYAGSIEPHVVAGVFALLGPSVESFRAAMAILLAVLVGGIVLLARRILGPTGAMGALAYLAIPPFFLLYKGLTSDGAYDSVALVALGELAVSLELTRRRERGEPLPRAGLLALLGFLAGLGWWLTPVTLPISAVCVVWVFWGRSRAPRARALVALGAGAAAGSLPWWIWNARHSWGSLRAPELGSASMTGILGNAGRLLWIALPALEGGVAATPDAGSAREPFPGARILCLALLLLLLAPSFAAAIRTRDRVRGLLWCCLLALLGAAALSRRTVPSEPRYLMAYYAILPLLAASELVIASRRRTAVIAVAGLIGVHLAGLVASRPNRYIQDLAVTGSLDPLVHDLEAEKIRTAYADYWTAYRLSFESGERVLATPFPTDELVRYAPYRRAADADPNPAVVLLAPRDACYRRFLDQERLPYARASVGAYGVYSHLDPRSLVSLRSDRGLPLPADAYRVRWDRGPEIPSLTAGSSRPVEIRVTNAGPCVWPYSVHLSYHWWPLDPGVPPRFENARGYLPGPLYPGRAATIPVSLRAPARPGRYRLEYDLVHENVVWFAEKGGKTWSVETNVLSGDGPGPPPER
jgi:hypothetical protein